MFTRTLRERLSRGQNISDRGKPRIFVIVFVIRGPRAKGMGNEPIDAGKSNMEIANSRTSGFATFIVLNFEVDIERSSKKTSRLSFFQDSIFVHGH